MINPNKNKMGKALLKLTLFISNIHLDTPRDATGLDNLILVEPSLNSYHLTFTAYKAAKLQLRYLRYLEITDLRKQTFDN